MGAARGVPRLTPAPPRAPGRAGGGRRPGAARRGGTRAGVAAGLRAELVERDGEPDLELAELAKAVDAVLVGRRGVSTKGDALGPTASSLIRIAERCVIVCGGLPSPMTSCALAFDGRETSRRALELAARVATVVGSTVHVIHPAEDRDAGR